MEGNNTHSDMKILIADDVPTMRKILQSMLRYLGYKNFTIVEDGVEAWEVLENDQPIDLVISDWNMPRMTGIELLHKIRSTFKYENMPFIMVTGEVDEASVARATEIDVDSYILKPFVPKELDDKIASVINNRNNPSDYQKLLYAGRALSRERKINEAITYFNAAIGMAPGKPIAYCFMGQLLEDTGDLSNAKNYYLKALSRNRSYIRALDGLARIYELVGEKKGLFDVLNLLIKVSPLNVSRQLALGRLALEVDQKERARVCLKRVAELEPGNEEQLFEVGTLLIEHNILDDAEGIFASLLQKSPKNAHYLHASGEIFRRLGMFERARNMFKMALDIAPNEQIHYNMARMYVSLGSKRLAEYHLEHALMIKRDFKEAKILLGRLDELIEKVKKQKETQ